MSTHVLPHESVSVSPFWVDGSITDIMSNTQVRLTEFVLMLIRLYHPHLEQLLFKGSEFRVSLRELKFTPSLTVEEMPINPWKSSIMDVNDDLMVIDSGTSMTAGHPDVTAPGVNVCTKHSAALVGSLLHLNGKQARI